MSERLDNAAEDERKKEQSRPRPQQKTGMSEGAKVALITLGILSLWG